MPLWRCVGRPGDLEIGENHIPYGVRLLSLGIIPKLTYLTIPDQHLYLKLRPPP